MIFQFDDPKELFTEEAMAKILLVTGDGAESLEVMYPYHRLLEEGYQVDIAAPSKKTLHLVVHDFEPDWETNTEKPGIKFNLISRSLRSSLKTMLAW
jgi:putative intracellular protease/amidase